jgi:hypothetical protein
MTTPMETKQATFLSTSKAKDAPNARFILLKPVGYSLRPIEGSEDVIQQSFTNHPTTHQT